MKKSFYRPSIAPMHIPALHRSKWPLALLAEGFVPFAKTALRSVSTVLQGPKRLEQLVVILAVIDYKRPNLTRPLSLEYLAFTTGFSTQETLTILSELRSTGIIASDLNPEDLQIDLSGFYEAITEASIGDFQVNNAVPELPDDF